MSELQTFIVTRQSKLINCGNTSFQALINGLDNILYS